MDRTSIGRARQAHTRAIKRILRPHLRASGFVDRERDGTRTPTRLWVPRTKAGEATLKSFALRRGFVIGAFMGFTSDGVITDLEGGALEVMQFGNIPLEDLAKLHDWAEQRFATPSA